MRKRLLKIISIALASTLVGLAALVLYRSGSVVFRQLGALDANVAAAIIAALAAATGALYTQRSSRSQEISESHRPQKIEVYNVYMDIIDSVMNLSKKGQLGDIAAGAVPQDLEKLLRQFRRGLIVWASPQVILAYDRSRRPGKEPVDVLRRADMVFQAIRKDLGSSNWGLREGDLIKLFLADPDEYDKLVAANSSNGGAISEP